MEQQRRPVRVFERGVERRVERCQHALIGNGAGQLGSTIKEMDGTAHNKMVAAFSHTTKMAGAAGGGLGNALGRDPNGKGKDGGAQPDRDAGITVGPREPEIDDPAGKRDEAKGKPGRGAAGDEGSLSSARRAAKQAEGSTVWSTIARLDDAVPSNHAQHVHESKPRKDVAMRDEYQLSVPQPIAGERVAQSAERPVPERKPTLAESLEAFAASLDRQDEGILAEHQSD